jgi:pimeloyl-ACP methyl ester carboxylesterase
MTAGAAAAATAAPGDRAAAEAAARVLLQSADRTHALPDGRQLAYIDCGDTGSGHVVLFFHPVQGNRWAGGRAGRLAGRREGERAGGGRAAGQTLGLEGWARGAGGQLRAWDPMRVGRPAGTCGQMSCVTARHAAACRTHQSAAGGRSTAIEARPTLGRSGARKRANQKPRGPCWRPDAQAPHPKPPTSANPSPHPRLMSLIFNAEARRLGLRVIAADRPGYGRSSPHPGRSVGSFVTDIAHLLAALGITRVAVLGSSAGSMVGGLDGGEGAPGRGAALAGRRGACSTAAAERARQRPASQPQPRRLPPARRALSARPSPPSWAPAYILLLAPSPHPPVFPGDDAGPPDQRPRIRPRHPDAALDPAQQPAARHATAVDTLAACAGADGSNRAVRWVYKQLGPEAAGQGGGARG